METKFVYKKKIRCNSRHMEHIFKLKIMILGMERGITYMVNRKRLTITNSYLIRPFVLRLTC